MFTTIMAGHDAGDVRRHALSRREYDRLVDEGIIAAGEPIELLRGEIVAVSPMGDPHVLSVSWLTRLLVAQFDAAWLVQPQCPLKLWDDSEPEPDVAVVPASRDFRDHATSCALVVEVADRSARTDATVKAALYAEAAIPVYWLVDLNAREVMVHSEPRDGQYRRLERRTAPDVLTLDGHPGVAVPVAAIVPGD